MSDKPPAPTPLPDSISSGGFEAELGMVEEAAQTVRRMAADESFNSEGMRIIWHRGRQRVEVLSHESRDQKILRQEMSIFGMVVEFRDGYGVRTGNIPINDEASLGPKPVSHLITLDEIPDRKALSYASHLLKHVKGRDFYLQHLLKVVNEAINNLGFDESRTTVGDMQAFSREQQRNAPTMPIDRRGLRETQIITPPTSRKSWLLAVLLGLLGVAGGVGLAWLLGLL